MRPHYLVHVFLLAVAVFFLASPSATAGGTVTAPPLTILSNGETASLVILGRIETQGTVRLTFDYPRSLITINGARGADGYGFTCPAVTIVSNENLSSITGRIVLECPSGGTISNDTILILDVTASSEKTSPWYGWLTPITLLINGASVSDVVLTAGRIELPSASHAPDQPSEGIAGLYPNPFAYNSQIVFTLSEAGNVQFSMFSAQGRLAKEIPTMQGVKGQNTYSLVLQKNEIAQGEYVLRMITDRGVYYQSFLVLN